ncbi:MFS transporter [Flexivirga caeni]|uniref:MFS transporter n=1 Tax=Flexivirga caeni TaxID=2294115 RepID=UPI00131503E1|nr:MFS transporter [Flexivirga caeni]
MLVLVLAANGTSVLDVFLIRHIFGMPAGWYGLVEVVFTVGAVVGSVTSGRFKSDRSRVQAIQVGLGVIALGVLGIGVSPAYRVLLVLTAFLGVALGVMTACFGPLFTVRTPDAMRGRVSSTVNGLMQAASVISFVLFGALGASLGVRASYVLSVVVVAGFAVQVQRALRREVPSGIGQSAEAARA